MALDSGVVEKGVARKGEQAKLTQWPTSHQSLKEDSRAMKELFGYVRRESEFNK